ncbi:hypothetical protein TRVA0_009S03136 [Trichomonascus vanleenenianus]|uniref:Zn(II)2Cys6 transcription factor n=1 Tax=Trichomonascus vanleenenianus TaxID=2268995 RepID=UPI003ECA077C
MENESSAPTPNKRTKSRTGCVTCKKRRLKCDETKPTCLKCAQRNVICGGYVKSFKWRSFEETNVCAKITKTQPEQAKPTYTSLSSQNGTHSQSIDDLIQETLQSAGFANITNQETSNSSTRWVNPACDSLDFDPNSNAFDSANGIVPLKELKSPSGNSPFSFKELGLEPFSPLAMNINSDGPSGFPSPTEVASSTDSTFMSVFSTSVHQKDTNNELIQCQRRLAYTWSDENHAALDKWISKYRSNNDFQRVLSAKVSLPSLHLSDDHERIFQLYTRFTCGILSIKDGPTENPWRTTLWPLAQDYGSLYHAAAALTKLHHSRQIPELRPQAVEHIKQSLRFLVTGLADKSLPPDIALATALSLALSEGWLRDVSTSVSHLKGASTIVKQLVHQHRGEALPPWLQFLYNCWLYLDICTRFVSDTYDERIHVDEIDDPAVSVRECSAEAPADKSPFDTSSSDGDSSPSSDSVSREKGSSISQGYIKKQPLHDDVDPLIGCGQKLFPLIAEVASLVQTVRKSDKPSLLLINRAVELKRELENWNPVINYQMTKVEDPAWDLQSCLATAEAYRYAALLYLHQAVPEIPSPASHELAEKVLVLLASIPASSRTAIVHVFPLLIAGCEAKGEDREWVRGRWKVLCEWMPIGNVEKAFEVVREVWRRKDIRSMEREKSRIKLHEGSKDGTTVRSSREIAAVISLKVAEAFGTAFVEENLEEDGVKGWCHWTAVMKDRGWEVLLG